jgi:UrcA family protein
MRTLILATASAVVLSLSVGPTLAYGTVSTTQSQSQSSPSSARPAARSSDVMQAQHTLAAAGLYDGKVDGIDGPKTEWALKQFQKQHYLRQTGKLDWHTKQNLALYQGSGSRSASAQQQTQTAMSGEINITAPYTTHRRIIGRTSTGIPVEELSLARPVSYADLDLRKQADVMEFERRINQAAKQACGQLNTMYPEALYPPMPSDQHCVRDAAFGGMTQANFVIASAGR